MKHTITLIPGDGIGPEIIAATVRIIEASGVEIDWETQIIGAQALEKFGETLPAAAHWSGVSSSRINEDRGSRKGWP